MLSEGPVGDINVLRPSVIELDERVGRVDRRAGAGAELVDLDWADIPDFLGRRVDLGAAACWVGPPGVGDQVAIEGPWSRGDLKRSAHARTRCNRPSEGRCPRGRRGPSLRRGDAQ